MAKKTYTVLLLLAALVVSATAQQTNQGATTWAVVIGVSKYQKLPGGQQLQFAERDAALFVEAIQKRGVNTQNVRLLTGPEATAAAIKSAVGNWLARSVSASDTVLIFFSGHGMFEREFGESYLLGYDSDPKDPYGTALSVSELGQALSRRVRSARVLIVADAVRRDFFDPESDSNSSKSFEQALEQLTASRPGAFAIVASGPGEFSREGQRWGGHGVFTKHLADVLFDGADRNSDLAVAADNLFDLLKGRVSEDTSGKQRPWRTGGIGSTDVARVEKRSSPAVTQNTEPAAKPASPAVAPPASVQPKNSVAVDNTKPNPASTPPVEKKTEPRISAVNEKKPEPASNVAVGEAGPAAKPAGNTGNPVRTGVENPAATGVDPKRAAASNNSSPNPAVRRAANPPGPATVSSTPPASPPPRELARGNIPVGEIATPPKPAINPPSAVVVSSERATGTAESVSASIPAVRPEAAPSPLVLQVEAAIASRTLIEPRNTSAWDLYQRLQSESGTAAEAARLKPVLAQALISQGRAIVGGDVRSDNISDKVDDFKRAGQMLARARSLTPENVDVNSLEKLSAAEALISLQFYDEAERALAPLQAAKLAAVENALGLVYQGKLDAWRAERAFKRASELDTKWAAPHHNLALLYRSQQNQAALGEFEAAAASDPNNLTLLTALGDEYFTRQQWKQAADAFSRAIALKPSDDNLHTKLGHALYSQGLQEEANREYQKAQELRRRQP